MWTPEFNPRTQEKVLDLVAFPCHPGAGEMGTGGSLDSLAKQPSLLCEVHDNRPISKEVGGFTRTTYECICLPVYPHTRAHTYTKLSLKFITLRFYLIQQGYALSISLTVLSLKRASWILPENTPRTLLSLPPIKPLLLLPFHPV